MIQHTASKFFRALCGMAVMLVLAAGITSVPASAASAGIYIAAAVPHYKHPITGRIEDSGGDGAAVLGQSMTESATYKKALVEVDSAGNTYITVRLKLMDNIQNPRFQADGNSVSASLMQEDYTNNTADYRMKVTDENSVIRCNMYVVPMGREVIFYITVSDLQAGSEDFITDVKVEQSGSAGLTGQTQSVDSQSSLQNDSSKTASAETSSAESREPAENSEKEDNALGLQEFDKNGNKVEQNSNKTESGKGKESSSVIWWILSGIVIAAAAGGCVWHFCFFRKRK